MGIIDLIFPKNCLECKKSGRYLCNSCIAKVKFAKGICPMCGKEAIDGMTHVRCKKPHGMDGLVSLWFYKGVVRKAILKLKYNFASDVSEELADAFISSLTKSDKPLPADSIFVPIPLHKARKNWRGFNQTEEIGKYIAKKEKWVYRQDLIIRRVKKTPQTQMKKKEDRLKNAQGIFSLKPDYQLPATNYLIFDDVWTTGATMREAAKVLKRNGASSVWGLTIAH